MSNESKQFSIVHEKMIVLNDVNSVIAAECNAVPAVDVIVCALVTNALKQIKPDLDLNKIYINRVAVDPKGSYQPVGALFQVVQECLERRLRPQYTIGFYGVYDQPNSTSFSAQIKTLGIYDIEKLIESILANLVPGYGFHLNDYWVTAIGTDAQGRQLLAPKDRLEQLYAKAFWAELDLVVHNGHFTADEQGWINRAYSASRVWPQSIFNVSIVGNNGEVQVLPAAFVIQIDGATKNELIPANDGCTCALYLPNDGLRRFSDSLNLQRAITELLSVDSSRKALLEALPVEGASSLKGALGVRFFNIKDDLFSYCATGQIEKQALDITHYWKKTQETGSDYATVMDSLRRTQGLIQVAANGSTRAARYLQQATRNAWPQWLKVASKADQQRYVALEKAHLQSEVELHERVGNAVSLKAYARASVEQHVFQRTGTKIDPDHILVTIRHAFRLGSKKIEHEEQMTLTELSISGLHDKSARFIFRVGGPTAAVLTQGFVESVIETLDLRVKYPDYRHSVYRQTAVQDALIETAGRLTALSVFSAQLQNHLKPKGLEVVQRCNLGDQAFVVWGVLFRNGHTPFKDMIVYSQPNHQTQFPHVLYAPGAPGGRDWFEFASYGDLQKHIAGWCAGSEGLEYVVQQSIPADQVKIERELKESGALAMAGKSNDIRVVDWRIEPKRPLRMSVQQAIESADQAQRTSTPDWFKAATLADRQTFARLHTEHKAIFALTKETGSIIPFQTFARDLVKRELNQYLSRWGAHPELDPDQIEVNLKGHSAMTLTQLFINWEVWRSDTSPFIQAFAWVHPVASVVVQIKDTLRTATFKSRDGKNLDRLNGAVISELIDLLPGDKYIAYLKKDYVGGKPEDRSARAALYGKLKQNRMQRDALVQKVKGKLTPERYDWLKAILDRLDTDTHSYPSNGWIYGCYLKGKRVDGAYWFAGTVNGRSENILYLPGSVEEEMFRTADDINADLRGGALKNTILECVRLQDRATVENYFHEIRQRKSTLELSGVKMAISALHYEYAPMVDRFIADVDHQTTSFSEAFWRDTMIVVEFVVDVASLFIPPVGLVASLLKATRSIVRGIGAYNNGDDKAANAHFAAAWVGLITAYLGKVSGVGGIGAGMDTFSKINDYASLVSTATGVTVGANYLTYVASQTIPSTHGMATTRVS